MAAATPNAADLAAGQGNIYMAGMLRAIYDQVKVFMSFPAYDMKGTFIYALALAALPSAGGFLDLNEGMISSKAQLVMGKVEAKRIGALIESAKSSTDLWNSTHPGMNWLDIQVKARLLSELQNFGKTVFLGTVNDAKAFYGLKQICSPTTANTMALTASATVPFSKSVLNAAGTTANTATSIYTVCQGPEDAALYMGGPQGVAGFLAMKEIKTQYQTDPGDATRKQEYYLTDGEGYAVISLMGSSEAFADRKYPQFSVRRAMNVTADSGAKCTEALLDKLLSMHPSGHKPTAIYMSIRSQEQLLLDRIANGTVQLQPGQAATKTVRLELPTEHRGIPIIVAELEITDDQAIETVS